MKIKELIEVIFTPTCWIRNYPTCGEWDYFIKTALENPNFKESSKGSRYIVILNGKAIWTCNKFYAYGKEYRRGSVVNVLPARVTQLKLEKAIKTWKNRGGSCRRQARE